MKNKKALTIFCLLAACSLLFSACTGVDTPLVADPKLPGETTVAPEDTISKEGQTLSVYEPAPEVDEPVTDPWAVAPPEPTGVTLPSESEIIEPGLIAVGEFQELRVQGISADKMKFLISKYLPTPGSESTLSFVHMTNADSLKAFMQEVDSNVFREACAPYDDDFFAEYDLLIIPRITNTGSLQHSVEQVKEEGVLRVSVGVTEPEYSTTVMTNWLLAVPVLKSDTQGVTIVVGMDIAADLPMPTVGLGKLG